jgi:hypothetical protein
VHAMAVDPASPERQGLGYVAPHSTVHGLRTCCNLAAPARQCGRVFIPVVIPFVLMWHFRDGTASDNGHKSDSSMASSQGTESRSTRSRQPPSAQRPTRTSKQDVMTHFHDTYMSI